VSDRTVEILEAACRVIAGNGAARLRMSDVASEAGVSSALVHYYFATRADLIRRAFAYSDDLADARVTGDSARHTDPVDRLFAVLAGYLNDDDASRRNAILWREMWSHAAFDPTLRDALVELYETWIDQLVALVQATQETGRVRADLAAEPVARRLAGLVDGLSAQLVLRMLDASQAQRLVNQALAQELGLRLTVAEPSQGSRGQLPL
jgi:AcrR family transcriptional regulator